MLPQHLPGFTAGVVQTFSSEFSGSIGELRPFNLDLCIEYGWPLSYCVATYCPQGWYLARECHIPDVTEMQTVCTEMCWNPYGGDLDCLKRCINEYSHHLRVCSWHIRCREPQTSYRRIDPMCYQKCRAAHLSSKHCAAQCSH